MSGELVSALTRAAAEAMHSARCQCGKPGHVTAYREAASVATVAVLETLARSGQVAWADSLAGLASAVRGGVGDGD